MGKNKEDGDATRTQQGRMGDVSLEEKDELDKWLVRNSLGFTYMKTNWTEENNITTNETWRIRLNHRWNLQKRAGLCAVAFGAL